MIGGAAGRAAARVLGPQEVRELRLAELGMDVLLCRSQARADGDGLPRRRVDVQADLRLEQLGDLAEGARNQRHVQKWAEIAAALRVLWSTCCARASSARVAARSAASWLAWLTSAEASATDTAGAAGCAGMTGMTGSMMIAPEGRSAHTAPPAPRTMRSGRGQADDRPAVKAGRMGPAVQTASRRSTIAARTWERRSRGGSPATATLGILRLVIRRRSVVYGIPVCRLTDLIVRSGSASLTMSLTLSHTQTLPA